jgi:ubiquitin fusion degradation protein 1
LTNYSCLYKGDTICINYGGRDFMIDVVECKPDDAICVVEADIEVDFRPPHDYKEIPL